MHIGDRESDIYELFCTAQESGTQFLLRTCVDRLAGDGQHTIAAEMAEVPCKGLRKVEVRDRHGKMTEAVLELKFRRMLVQPPLYKQGDTQRWNSPCCMRPSAVSHGVAIGLTGS